MGLFDNVKDNMKGFAEQAKDLSTKTAEHADSLSTDLVAKEASKYLLDGEQIIMAHKYWNDWACITNKRLMFVEKEYTGLGRKELISIPFSSISEVNVDFGAVIGEVEVVTRSKTHELKLGKGAAQRFANAILSQIL